MLCAKEELLTGFDKNAEFRNAMKDESNGAMLWNVAMLSLFGLPFCLTFQRQTRSTSMPQDYNINRAELDVLFRVFDEQGEGGQNLTPLMITHVHT